MNAKKRDQVESRSVASFSEITRVKCDLDADFSELSKAYPYFDSAWKELLSERRKRQGKCFSSHVNFKFNVSLTRAVLYKEFKLQLPSMPEENLVPPVPNRFNYILWIKNLIQESSSDEYFLQEGHFGLVHRGLDLGVGCSAIYPLLLSTDHFSDDTRWKFFGTDIDFKSVKCANENIKANNLQNKIQIALVCQRTAREYVVESETYSKEGFRNDIDLINLNERSTPLCTAIKAARKAYQIDNHTILFDFLLTNPPFYSTEDDASKPRNDGRERIEFTSCESVYPGGEMGFARDMITDSLIFRELITWYTIMVSKKESLQMLKKDLISVGIPNGNIRTAEFLQGKMIRWAIGWTYLKSDLRSLSNRTIGGLHSFDVVLKSKLTKDEVRDVLIKRIHVFCKDFTSLHLRYRVLSDELSEDQVICIEDDSSSPPQFAIDCRFQIQNTETSCISVILQSFASSTIALAKIRRLQMKLQGEICQSNRKYRRRNQVQDRI